MIKRGSNLAQKLGNTKVGKFTVNTAKNVFSAENLKEFGRPVLLGTALFLGLEKLGTLDLEAVDYFYTSWATKLACYGSMNFKDVKEKNYKQITKEIGQDAKTLAQYAQSEVTQGLTNARKYVKEGLDSFAEDQPEGSYALMTCR